MWMNVGIRAGFQSGSSGKTAARMVSLSVFVNGRAGWNTAVYVGGEKLVDHLALTRSDSANVDKEVETRVDRIRAVARKQ